MDLWDHKTTTTNNIQLCEIFENRVNGMNWDIQLNLEINLNLKSELHKTDWEQVFQTGSNNKRLFYTTYDFKLS